MVYLFAVTGVLAAICLVLIAGAVGSIGTIGLNVATTVLALSLGGFAMSATAIDG